MKTKKRFIVPVLLVYMVIRGVNLISHGVVMGFTIKPQKAARATAKTRTN